VAVEHSQGTQPEAAMALSWWGKILFARYLQNGGSQYLVQSLKAAEQATRSLVVHQNMASTIDRYPMWPSLVHDLGQRLHDIYQLTRQLTTLDNAIKMMRVAVRCTAEVQCAGWRSRPNLGTYLQLRYRRTAVESDLGESGTALRQTTRAMPHNKPGKARVLNQLGNQLAL
jgi:hypothetical protein